MSDSKVFCSVTIGINTCGICYNNAFFSRMLPPAQHDTLPVMQLFKCGHGMCNTCWEQIKNSSKHFVCPFCRTNGGTRVVNFEHASLLSLEARGIIDAKEVPPPTKEIYTYEEFLEEWEDRTYLLCHSKHHFMMLYRQMIHTEKMVLLDKSKHQEEQSQKKALNDKTWKRKLSRQSAICHICNKDTFTSEKQLHIHIKAKHG